jgi:hypothetical protein
MVDGEHILASLGNSTWIKADLVYCTVIPVPIPEPDNLGFKVPLYVVF